MLEYPIKTLIGLREELTKKIETITERHDQITEALNKAKRDFEQERDRKISHIQAIDHAILEMVPRLPMAGRDHFNEEYTRAFENTRK